MATANADIEVRRTVKGVTLTMTGPEASALLYLTNQIAGAPLESARGLIDQINEALIGAGVTAPSSEDADIHDGQFHFRKGSRTIFTNEQE